MKKIIATLLFILAFFPYNSFAGEVAYTCKVLHVYTLNDDGSLGASPFQKDYIGSKFSVSRIDGQIVGEVVTTILAKSTFVKHKGNKRWSFRAMADFETSFQLIDVQEFKRGKQKPFIASSMGGAGIVTGMCE